MATSLGLVVGWWLIANRIWTPLTVSIVAIGVLLVAALTDRDAVAIRAALIEYVFAAPGQMRPGFPRDPSTAEAWLADPANTNDLDRAAVYVAVDDPDAARAALARASWATPIEAARAERLRIVLSEDPAAEPRSEYRRRLADLPPEDARFQALALAIMLLDSNLKAGRPWRSPLLSDVRWLRPFRLTRRGWALVLWRESGPGHPLAPHPTQPLTWMPSSSPSA